MRYHVQQEEHKCKKENWSLLGFISIFGSRRFLPIFLPFLTIIFSIFLPFLCVSPFLPLSPSGFPALPGNIYPKILIAVITKTYLSWNLFFSNLSVSAPINLIFRRINTCWLIISLIIAPQVVKSVISGNISPNRSFPLPPNHLQHYWTIRCWTGG